MEPSNAAAAAGPDSATSTPTQAVSAPRSSVALPLLIGAGCAAIGGLVLAAPTLFGFDVIPPCPFLTLTGLECPFCGGTRATRALLTGDPMTALDDNALVPLAAIGVVVLGVWWVASRRVERWSFDPVTRTLTNRTTWWVLGGLVAVFWVARNLPLLAGLSAAT